LGGVALVMLRRLWRLVMAPHVIVLVAVVVRGCCSLGDVPRSTRRQAGCPGLLGRGCLRHTAHWRLAHRLLGMKRLRVRCGRHHHLGALVGNHARRLLNACWGRMGGLSCPGGRWQRVVVGPYRWLGRLWLFMRSAPDILHIVGAYFALLVDGAVELGSMVSLCVNLGYGA
jgi:hypothetical protein